MKIIINIDGYPVTDVTGMTRYFTKQEFPEWFKKRFYPNSVMVEVEMYGANVHIPGPVAMDMLIDVENLIAYDCMLRSYVHIELEFCQT